MKLILAHVGAPQEVLAMLTCITGTCKVCRMWVRPAKKTKNAVHLYVSVNKAIHCDIFFQESETVGHLVEC